MKTIRRAALLLPCLPGLLGALAVQAQTFLRVDGGGRETFHPVEAGDSLTFLPDGTGHRTVLHTRSARDTFPADGADSLRALVIRRAASIVVEAGAEARVPGPLSALLPDSLAKARALKLVEIRGKARADIPCQLESPANLWWWMSDTLPAGMTRRYELELADPRPAAAPITLVPEGDFLQVRWGASPILSYVVRNIQPAGTAANYSRSGYIHSLHSPTSRRLMIEDGPADHPHHRGINFLWKTMTFQGRHLEIWDYSLNHGNVYLDTILSRETGPVFAAFTARHRYVEFPGNRRVLDEVYRLKAWNAGGPSGGYWLWDLSMTQSAGTDSVVTVEQKEYGGMSIRGAKEWKGSALAILTSEATTGAASWGSASRWNSISGAIAGGWTALTVFSHPGNQGHPERAQNYPDLSYIGFTPSQAAPFAIRPGAPRTFRYRFLAQEGAASAPRNDGIWKAFGQPPTVRLAPIP